MYSASDDERTNIDRQKHSQLTCVSLIVTMHSVVDLLDVVQPDQYKPGKTLISSCLLCLYWKPKFFVHVTYLRSRRIIVMYLPLRA